MSETKHATLWMPRYWLGWGVIAALYLLTFLPFSIQFWIGRRLGRLILRLAKRRAKILRKNLCICFPELSGQELDTLVLRSMEAHGVMLAEIAFVWMRNLRRIVKRTEIVGLDLLENALREQKGVLVLGAHLLTLELAGAVIADRCAFDCVYRRSKNELVNFLADKSRKRRFRQTIEIEFLLSAIKRLRAGNAVWLAIDQDMGHKRSVFVPFFGEEAATVAGPSRIVSRTGANVLFMSHFRNDRTQTWTIRLDPIEDYPSGDVITDAAHLNRVIERAIRACPEQYLWVHRRFKSLPGGGRRKY